MGSSSLLPQRYLGLERIPIRRNVMSLVLCHAINIEYMRETCTLIYRFKTSALECSRTPRNKRCWTVLTRMLSEGGVWLFSNCDPLNKSWTSVHSKFILVDFFRPNVRRTNCRARLVAQSKIWENSALDVSACPYLINRSPSPCFVLLCQI